MFFAFMCFNSLLRIVVSVQGITTTTTSQATTTQPATTTTRVGWYSFDLLSCVDNIYTFSLFTVIRRVIALPHAKLFITQCSIDDLCPSVRQTVCLSVTDLHV